MEHVLRLLRGHVSQETAYLVEDYPYGWLRCQMRHWIESPTKGAGKGRQRHVTQTSNPKRDNDWRNKPKAGTFCDRFFLYHDSRTGYVHAFGVEFNGPSYFAKFVASGLYAQLTDEEKADLQTQITDDRTRYRGLNNRPWVEHENIMARIRALALTRVSPDELYKLGGFDGPLAELRDQDGQTGGCYRNVFNEAYNRVRAEDMNEWTPPDVIK